MVARGEVVGTVRLLSTRYAKSLHSPYASSIRTSWAGVVDDRGLVVVDHATGKVLTAKQAKVQDMLGCSAFWLPEGRGEIMIEVPGFEALPWWDNLTPVHLYEVLGRRVEVVRVAEHPSVRVTNAGFSLRPGVGVDSRPFSWVTTAALETARAYYSNPGAFDPARLRMTGVIQTLPGFTGFPEDNWIGRILVFPSGVQMLVVKGTVRCGLPPKPHPQDGLSKDFGMLAALEELHEKTLGVYCILVDPAEPGRGVIEEGDEVKLV